jgi:hypothetical protein
MNNGIYLRRQRKIVVPHARDGVPAAPEYLATVVQNLEPLGFVFSLPLLQACRPLSVPELNRLYREVLAHLQKAKGAHRKHRPMYPNFPDQVMSMGEAELYLNAVIHYWTAGRFLPETELKERPPLRQQLRPLVIDLGTREEFEQIFVRLVSSNSSLSEQDREDVSWFVRSYRDDIARLLPETIPQKETVAFVAALLAQHTGGAVAFVERYVRTATDVLRLAVALSEGDVSLAEPTKFRNFRRGERRLLLGLLDRHEAAMEDMLRWKGRWVRLGEKLHPGEYAHAYPNAAAAFDVLRNDRAYTTFNGKIERALENRDVTGAVRRLAGRPGYLARRLDHLLRVSEDHQRLVIAGFAEVAQAVSTPVLLQVLQHFRGRQTPDRLRVFFPKGNLAKAHAEPNTLPSLPAEVCAEVAAVCEAALLQRFAALPALGRVYVDPELRDYLVPFSVRSSSRTYRTVGRGSRLALPECQVLRFFIWWKNGRDETDLDLSATLLDSDFNFIDDVAYYNLKGYGGAHSGDIVDAPKGASEFIDITLSRLTERNVRYVVMSVMSYTAQSYCDLPECFAGWMARADADSGEIFDPRTVQDRLDITANTRIAVPLVIDVQDGQVIWCDMALRSDPRWQNNARTNLGGVSLTVQALVTLSKPNLLDLLVLHARARGQVVDSPEDADVTFSVANETPFHPEVITAEYLR